MRAPVSTRYRTGVLEFGAAATSPPRRWPYSKDESSTWAGSTMFFRATALRACALGRISVRAVVLDGCREGGGGATARADWTSATCVVEASDPAGFGGVGNGGKPEEVVSSTRGF